MSIGKRVSEAIEKMDASDSEGALFAICATIDATAVKEFNKRGESGYLAGGLKLPPFLEQNQLTLGQRRFTLSLRTLCRGKTNLICG